MFAFISVDFVQTRKGKSFGTEKELIVDNVLNEMKWKM